MSHIEQASIAILDLNALLKAAEEIVGQGKVHLVDAPTYNCWPKRVGDYPLPKGMKEEDWGKCEKKLKIDGVLYEIGLVRDGKAWRMRYDFFGCNLESKSRASKQTANDTIYGADGGCLLDHFGNGLGKLAQGYTVQMVRKYAARTASMVGKPTVLSDGRIQIKVGVR